MDYLRALMNRLFVPFCMKTVVMEILIGAMILFYMKRIETNGTVFSNKVSDNNNEVFIHFNPRSDFFIESFLWTSFLCVVFFYFVCNLITIGMKNVQLRYALILIGMCISVINILLCVHIIHEYYHKSLDKTSFGGQTDIIRYSLIFSVLTFFTGIYALFKGSEDMYVIKNGNYYNLCFDITIIHLGFVGLVYYIKYFFLKDNKLFKYNVNWIKWIRYISFIVPFMWLFIGDIYVFNTKPFALVYKILSCCVFLVTFVYIILLIRLLTEMFFYSNYFELTQLFNYAIHISIQIFLSVLVLIIPLHIIFS